jgi:hypothetical protein
MEHYPGSQNSLAQFLSDVPDWSVLDKAALDKALQGLPVPMSGPVHRVYRFRTVGRNKSENPLIPSYTDDVVCDIVYMSIAFDIAYDILCDVVCDV